MDQIKSLASSSTDLVQNNSPFRTPLTNWTSSSFTTPSSNKENSTLSKNLLAKFDDSEGPPSNSYSWKEILDRDKEREQMKNSIKMLTEKNNFVKETLKREESTKQHQIFVMKKTHSTQLEIKNMLIRNLEDIIDEQEARIFNLESQISGLRNLPPEMIFNKQPLGGVRRLQEFIDELSNKITQQTEQLMYEEKLRADLERKQQQALVTNGHSGCKHVFSDGDNGRGPESVTDSEKRLAIVEKERLELRQTLTKMQNELEQTERAYKQLRLDYQRLDVHYSEKLLTAERKELDLHKQLAAEKAKMRFELELLKNDPRLKKNDTQNDIEFKRQSSNEIEALKGRLSTETKQREDAEKMLIEFKEQLAKQTAETKKWRSAVIDIEKQMEEETDRHKREISDRDAKLSQLADAFSRLRRESADWQHRHADTIISLDCFRASLRCLKEEQAALFEIASKVNVDMRQALISTRQKISRGITDTVSDLMAKYKHEMRLRKKFYNELMEIRGNIRVFCRVRPIIKFDLDKINAIEFDNIDERLIYANNDGRRQVFELDNVFRPDKSQSDIFAEIKPLLTSCVDGYNVCIFAYGQTGSGKTYTMDGPYDDPGINPRALVALFEETEARKPDWKFDISVSMLEIHNGSIRDLLSDNTKLDIKMASDGSLEVPGLSIEKVSDVDQVTKVLKIGRKNRVTASTKLNDVSSRSHAILCVSVRGYNHVTKLQTFGKLNLVDLAGSERVAKSEASGERLKEAQAINKSLSALGDVISALKNRRRHVPFRNSKLTYLLQDSLSGDSKTVMVVQVSPSLSSISETICSLSFASRVRSVDLGQATPKTAVLGNFSTPNGNFNPKENDSCNGSVKKNLSRLALNRLKK